MKKSIFYVIQNLETEFSIRIYLNFHERYKQQELVWFCNFGSGHFLFCLRVFRDVAKTSVQEVCYSVFCTKKNSGFPSAHVCYIPACLAFKPHHLSLLCSYFTQIGRSVQCMALKNFARRSFWTLPSSFSRILSGPESRIISSRITVANLSSLSEKWWTKNRNELGSATSTVDHARRHFQSSSPCLKRDDLSHGQMIASMPKIDEGTLGEHLVDVSINQ